MSKTELGAEVWNEYANSSTDDIYIGTSNFGSEDFDAVTTYDIKSDMTFGVIGTTVKVPSTNSSFTEFNNLNISKSKDKKISLVSLNSLLLAKNNKYATAKIIGHEFKAHVKNHKGRGKTAVVAEHKSVGEIYTQDRNGKYTGVTIEPNSFSDQFNRQIEQYRNSILINN